MNHDRQIGDRLGIREAQVAATTELLDQGNTIPFIARYRKEKTGGLDEDQLRQLSDLLEMLRSLDKRRQTILDSISRQDQLTPQLAAELRAAESLTELEDLYQPYKPKRRTRASAAREKGLSGLADLILAQPTKRRSLSELVKPYLGDKVTSEEEALAGARDIVAETISDHADVRRQTREKGIRWATLRCSRVKTAEDSRRVYENYYEFQWRVDQLRPHQVLAINRGEAEGVLRVSVEIPERDWRQSIGSVFRADRRSPLAGQLALAIEDAAKRLLLPAIERDIRRTLGTQAEEHAISVFARNLRSLLGQPPLAGHIVLGIDPGYRTGCKVAVVDATGKVLDTASIHPHAPQNRWEDALSRLSQLVKRHSVTLVAIGNGTASRETERLVVELIRSVEANGSVEARSGAQPADATELKYLMVNEAGASVYSASPLARAELPDLDVTLRGAVSIARRTQDPLAELVKIDPRSIGVGLYQHDVNQGRLTRSLAEVVESVVNRVGVDVNTASPALLTHVSGVGPKLAEHIVSFRDAQGPFPERQRLLQVPGLGPKAFEQAAGFLRINQGANPLDASAIHPESYSTALAVLERAGLVIDSEPGERRPVLAQWQSDQALQSLATELDTGVPTLRDILEQLIRPGRDPRSDLPLPMLREDVLTMDDLHAGMLVSGTVRNVVDFGVFVDIGVKQDGLLHRSQWPALAHFGVGDVVEVIILKVEAERGRISLGWPS